MQNTIPSPAGRSAAQEALARREAAYAEEVRRLLDAALDVMRSCGTEKRPRVADIVAAAGLSNDAFYRHFRSKDALVAALVDDGALAAAQLPRPPDGEGALPRGAGAPLGGGRDVAGRGRGGRHHARGDLER